MLTVSQLKTVYGFMTAFEIDPRIKFKMLHRKHSTYQALKSTIDLYRKAFDCQILIAPSILINAHIDVELIKGEETNPSDLFVLWDETIKRPEVMYAVLLKGAHSILIFKRGATLLTYAEAIKPSFPGSKKMEDIQPAEIGKLPHDHYPHGWNEFDWKVYDYLKYPREFSYRQVGEKLGVNWMTVKAHFKKILEDCKPWNSFFPRGIPNYYHTYMTFETDYEIGIREELQKIDRTSFIYKFGKTLLLYALLENQEIYKRFYDLEKEGIIHDLCVSVPVQWFKPDIIL